MEFLTDGLTLLKVNGEIPIYESDLTFKYLSVLPYWEELHLPR